MTTNTTNRQAASIRDDEQFMNELRQIADESIMQWPDWEAQIIAKFDAKLAQAREEGRRDSHETNVTMLNLKLKAEDRAAIAEDAWRAEKKRADKAEEWQEIEKEFSHSMEQHAIAAESSLAEIQRGVEVLRSIIEDGYLSDTNTARGHEVLAILVQQPQPTGCTHNCNQGRSCTCDTRADRKVLPAPVEGSFTREDARAAVIAVRDEKS